MLGEEKRGGSPSPSLVIPPPLFLRGLPWFWAVCVAGTAGSCQGDEQLLYSKTNLLRERCVIFWFVQVLKGCARREGVLANPILIRPLSASRCSKRVWNGSPMGLVPPCFAPFSFLCMHLLLFPLKRGLSHGVHPASLPLRPPHVSTVWSCHCY